MDGNKVCFIICWLGKLPNYLPVWLKTCAYNSDYDFLLFTDDSTPYDYPQNVIVKPFSKGFIISRIEERLTRTPSLKEAYRLCDYRPMYGIIFKEELEPYNYWGYCDIDVVFGKLNDYIPYEEIAKYDAIFNGGHLSLIKNIDSMNTLYKSKGAIFDCSTVMKKHAVFAFDETTGIQRIARENGVKAKFGVPYIETGSKYRQLRSRMEVSNPAHQGYYWEQGKLYRVKTEGGSVYYQNIAYIHLQKRKIDLLDETVGNCDSFWITPTGYLTKPYLGFPTCEDVDRNNPYEGEETLQAQDKTYKLVKMYQMLHRTPFQLYVRLRQQQSGINAGDGKRNEMNWEKC